MDTDIQDLGLLPPRLCPAGGGIGDDVDLHIQIPEYGHTVHFETTYYQPFSGGGAEVGLAVPQEVVGKVGAVFHGPIRVIEGRWGWE